MNVQTAQHLAELRRAKGYSQEALARELGLSRQAVSKWERAESSPDTDNLIALAKLYGVSLDELLQTSASIDDDIAFENRDRAAESASAGDAAERAAMAAAKATDAAAAAAQAANASARALSAATLTASKPKLKKGTFRSFPYWAVAIVLTVLLGSQTGAWAMLALFTIPVYHWVANILDAGLSEGADGGEALFSDADAADGGAAAPTSGATASDVNASACISKPAASGASADVAVSNASNEEAESSENVAL